MLKGLNYVSRFRFDRICDGCDAKQALQLLVERGLAAPLPGLQPLAYDEKLQQVRDALLWRGDASAGVQLRVAQEQAFHADLQQLVELLKIHFSPVETQVFSFSQSKSVAHWDFSLLLVSERRQAVYLLEGLGMD
jgi:hypothetical protein